MQMSCQTFANMAMPVKFGKLWVGCGCAIFQLWFPCMLQLVGIVEGAYVWIVSFACVLSPSTFHMGILVHGKP